MNQTHDLTNAELAAQLAKIAAHIEESGELLFGYRIPSSSDFMHEITLLREAAKRINDPHPDQARMDWLESKGVESIYFKNGTQLNPASMSLRAAIDVSPRL